MKPRRSTARGHRDRADARAQATASLKVTPSQTAGCCAEQPLIVDLTPVLIREPEEPGGLAELIEALAVILADVCVDAGPNAVVASGHPDALRRKAG